MRKMMQAHVFDGDFKDFYHMPRVPAVKDWI